MPEVVPCLWRRVVPCYWRVTVLNRPSARSAKYLDANGFALIVDVDKTAVRYFKSTSDGFGAQPYVQVIRIGFVPVFHRQVPRSYRSHEAPVGRLETNLEHAPTNGMPQYHTVPGSPGLSCTARLRALSTSASVTPRSAILAVHGGCTSLAKLRPKVVRRLRGRPTSGRSAAARTVQAAI